MDFDIGKKSVKRIATEYVEQEWSQMLGKQWRAILAAELEQLLRDVAEREKRETKNGNRGN